MHLEQFLDKLLNDTNIFLVLCKFHMWVINVWKRSSKKHPSQWCLIWFI